ncbi:hypothetical protein [Paenibacillus campinasensis]|uniref:Uncharacterized protein n=1 Tax=Paenibacillus campinasensis TaxID=66347 RepID=A0A268EXN3_9BACL|nr:hypothetical protein [Paenibacillus campinasensis]PAD77869.1 hypothetical protein CHH67_07650 [Paenibacillus campinasensis]
MTTKRHEDIRFIDQVRLLSSLDMIQLPHAHGIVQLDMAMGGGAVIGGIVIESISLASVGSLGGASVTTGLMPAIISLSLHRRSAAAERNGA